MRIAVALFLLAISAGSTLADKLVVLESKFSVKETLDRLASALDERGIKIAARLDHAAGAKAAGMELPPTELLIFGNPKLGTPLMQSKRAIGVDLPIRCWPGRTTPARSGSAIRRPTRSRPATGSAIATRCSRP